MGAALLPDAVRSGHSTPLAIDPASVHALLNKSLNLVEAEDVARAESAQAFGVSPDPAHPAAQFNCRAPTRSAWDYIYLGRLVSHTIAIFPGTGTRRMLAFRVTLPAGFIDEEETANLLKAVENELHNRRKGDAVRLEIGHDYPCPFRTRQTQNAPAHRGRFVFDRWPRVHAADDVDPGAITRPELPGINAFAPVAVLIARQTDIFAAIRERDILLRMQEISMASSILCNRRRTILGVLAIKQTLYRTGGGPAHHRQQR